MDTEGLMITINPSCFYSYHKHFILSWNHRCLSVSGCEYDACAKFWRRNFRRIASREVIGKSKWSRTLAGGIGWGGGDFSEPKRHVIGRWRSVKLQNVPDHRLPWDQQRRPLLPVILLKAREGKTSGEKRRVGIWETSCQLEKDDPELWKQHALS